MVASEITFYVVAVALLGSAAGVVWLKNTVHSAFLLVLTFGAVAVVYIMLNADFLAMAQLLVYVGAIIIMLLFALMLTQRKETVALGGPSENRNFVGGLVALLLFVVYFRVITASPWGNQDHSKTVLHTVVPATGGTAPVIGTEFFGTFLLPFEVASILLLMALVGAIVLAKRETS